MLTLVRGGLSVQGVSSWHCMMPVWVWDGAGKVELFFLPFLCGCCCCCLVTQLYLTLCNLMDCSPPGSSVHEILEARILEWVAMPFSGGSSQPRDPTPVSHIVGRFFTI